MVSDRILDLYPHDQGQHLDEEPRTGAVGERGSGKTVTEKPNTELIVWSLGHLTLTRMIASGYRKGTIYSNWNPIFKEIFGNI